MLISRFWTPTWNKIFRVATQESESYLAFLGVFWQPAQHFLSIVSYFMDKETEAQRGTEYYPRIRELGRDQLRLELSSPDMQATGMCRRSLDCMKGLDKMTSQVPLSLARRSSESLSVYPCQLPNRFLGCPEK